MSDFDDDDDDFSLGDDSSDDEPFTVDSTDLFGASDVSDSEGWVPKAKKARVSPTKPTAKTSTPKSRSVSTSSCASGKKTLTPNAASAKVKVAGKSPAPAKPTQLTAENAEAAVLDYMRKVSCKKELVSKTYGKSTIYYLNQNNLPIPSEDERVALEEQIKALTGECTALEQEQKSAEATFASLTSQISDADLDAALKKVDEEAAALETKVETLNQPGRAPVSPGRKDELKRKFTTYRTAWVARKRIAMDGVNQIADGMEKKPKAVLELVGLETDEEVGIKELPAI
ncbi:hypothetical protein PsorP6_011056 [Peronosclerospora sorghi]|uniref:Uncharacterized protein n=1 Tax=Peronosclerospora sorghi TaxID=230839 RepID=A0ACC0VXE0_9STRA|nr:hypothetical protein PsorP6_011056 [Peronosclerospora sorghi]